MTQLRYYRVHQVANGNLPTGHGSSEFYMFARADIHAMVDLMPFEWFCPPVAIRFLRRLRGGSQASLVECDDGSIYVVKMFGNPQGPNVLANEFLGGALARAAELPVPRTLPILLTETFLKRSSGLRFETQAGSYSPPSGLHLGSRFVGNPNDTSRLFEVLLPSHVRRIVNRDCFLGMYLLDLAATHQSHRQAVFVRKANLLNFDTVFIDNGSMFGGPAWSALEVVQPSLHRNMAIYLGLWDEDKVSAWNKRLQKVIPPALLEIVPQIPKSWFVGDIARLQDFLLQRLDNLPQLACDHSLNHSSQRSRTAIQLESTSLPLGA